ncbi:hypothetical protein JAAARDRAFT_199932 [Jaapia argillacea MUCL 33604]|uniref:Uncharacterized protein n=1 Tax=Jaapia argillacea MUCL 33604 TaxID=933084 RepID=A0A067PHN7_9AGAM|nr:hypothetical protein JAAARDRAFT_199932 [Jaapia argillacea MUCL 33604]
MSGSYLSDSSSPLLPTLNNLLANLCLPFTLVHPTDLIPSLLLAILESLLKTRLPIPLETRESSANGAKVEMMKVFLGVLGSDVLGPGGMVEMIEQRERQEDGGQGELRGFGEGVEVGLGEVDPRRLAAGEEDEVVFVGRLICWLARKMGILDSSESIVPTEFGDEDHPPKPSPKERERTASVSTHSTMNSVHTTFSMAYKPPRSDTSPSGSFASMRAIPIPSDASASSRSHSPSVSPPQTPTPTSRFAPPLAYAQPNATPGPSRPRTSPLFPRTSTSRPQSQVRSTSLQTPSTSYRTPAPSSVRRPQPSSNSKPSQSLTQSQPRCIHELELDPPSAILSRTPSLHTQRRNHSPSESEDSSGGDESDVSYCDCPHDTVTSSPSASHPTQTSRSPASTPRSPPVRYDGWISPVDEASEMESFEAGLRARERSQDKSRVESTPRKSSKHSFSGSMRRSSSGSSAYPPSARPTSTPTSPNPDASPSSTFFPNSTAQSHSSTSTTSRRKPIITRHNSPSAHTLALLNERARLLDELARLDMDGV